MPGSAGRGCVVTMVAGVVGEGEVLVKMPLAGGQICCAVMQIFVG